MKLCFICCEYPPGPHGGIGSFYQSLARSMVAKGHIVHVIGVYSHDYPAPDVEEDCGVHVRRLREPRTRFIGWIYVRIRLYLEIRRLINHGGIDLVEVPDYGGWCGGWPILPVPRVVRTHGSGTQTHTDTNRPVSSRLRFLESSSIRRATHWVGISNFIARRTQELFSLRQGPSAILYNSIEATPVTDFGKRSKLRVVFSGTLNENKGIRRLVQAWPTVRNNFPEVELHVFGKDGRTSGGEPMKFVIEGMLGNVNQSGVFFHGHVPRAELLEALQTARMAVYPSYTEAFALAPMESMIRECPTIYSKRASGPELVDDGIDGLLVDPDRPEEIAQAIVRLLQDDDLAMRLGKAGREKVKRKFSAEVIMSQNEAFFLKCIGEFRQKVMPD